MTPLLVFLGAGIGGVARYGVSRWTMSASSAFPWATLAVNVSGSFLITFLIGWAHTRGLSVERQTFIAAGFCGGYTTFSAFSVETLRFIEAGQWQRATIYITASVVLSLLGALAGLRLAPGHA
jgi:fluoride exporter